MMPQPPSFVQTQSNPNMNINANMNMNLPPHVQYTNTNAISQEYASGIAISRRENVNVMDDNVVELEKK